MKALGAFPAGRITSPKFTQVPDARGLAVFPRARKKTDDILEPNGPVQETLPGKPWQRPSDHIRNWILGKLLVLSETQFPRL